VLSAPAVSLIRLPKPARPQDYEQASREIEELLRTVPGISAIYRTGSVSAPGISDIDRIAVVDEGTQAPAIWPEMSPASRELAMHAPFLVDNATFERHRSFAYMEPLEVSWGEPAGLEDRALPAYSEPLIAAESMVVSLLSTVKQLSTGLVKVRPALCQLNNLRHALVLGRLVEDEAPVAWQLAADVTALRSGWFASPESDRLHRVRDVAARAVPALLEALWRLGEQGGAGGHGVSGNEDTGSRNGRDGAAGVRLAPPWSNVTLVPSDLDPPAPFSDSQTGSHPVSATPRLRVPYLRSTRLAEIAWRAARPRVALHPNVLDLLAGNGGREVRDFRSSRDELVRGYRDWLATNGPGYAEIGLASPFLPATAHSGRTRA
jgi:hypothetical protein